ncbi:MAG: thioredoxin family protein [Coriobacteriia bacterium]|nr:thioredoxin family protein [Coriobacteriia bacterium]
MAILLVVAVFIGVLVGLRFAGSSEDAQPLEAGFLEDSTVAEGLHPFEAYQDARAAGSPVYVLFHSGACQPCVEAKDAADRVLPEYTDTVVYVSAHTVDSRSRDLFDEFSFRSVPTSFFVDQAGEVIDEHVGPLSDAELRERLDTLLSAQ